jgi:hypothetical protein
MARRAGVEGIPVRAIPLSFILAMMIGTPSIVARREAFAAGDFYFLRPRGRYWDGL